MNERERLFKLLRVPVAHKNKGELEDVLTLRALEGWVVIGFVLDRVYEEYHVLMQYKGK